MGPLDLRSAKGNKKASKYSIRGRKRRKWDHLGNREDAARRGTTTQKNSLNEKIEPLNL